MASKVSSTWNISIFKLLYPLRLTPWLYAVLLGFSISKFFIYFFYYDIMSCDIMIFED